MVNKFAISSGTLLRHVGEEAIRVRGSTEIRGELRVESHGRKVSFHVGQKALLRTGDSVGVLELHPVWGRKISKLLNGRMFRFYPVGNT